MIESSPKVKFKALIKKVTSKALASLDKGYQVTLQGGDRRMAELVNAPADEEVEITVKYKE